MTDRRNRRCCCVKQTTDKQEPLKPRAWDYWTPEQRAHWSTFSTGMQWWCITESISTDPITIIDREQREHEEWLAEIESFNQSHTQLTLL